jgi:hypothetical protein
MDPSPEELIALAEQLNEVAKNAASSPDPSTRKQQIAALVLQAKQLIWRVQDPFDALMDHIVDGYTISACLACQKLGIFEAVPATGTATAQQVAKTCNAPEELVSKSCFCQKQLLHCLNWFSPSHAPTHLCQYL